MIRAKTIVAAYRRFLADQSSGARQRARVLTKPINKPRGMDREILKDNGASKTKGQDVVKPMTKDILPKDVFNVTPDSAGVLNLVQTGKDQSKAISQVRKDKGYDVVYNLSQHLIWTHGNGGEGTQEGKKK